MRQWATLTSTPNFSFSNSQIENATIFLADNHFFLLLMLGNFLILAVAGLPNQWNTPHCMLKLYWQSCIFLLKLFLALETILSGVKLWDLIWDFVWAISILVWNVALSGTAKHKHSWFYMLYKKLKVIHLCWKEALGLNEIKEWKCYSSNGKCIAISFFEIIVYIMQKKVVRRC